MSPALASMFFTNGATRGATSEMRFHKSDFHLAHALSLALPACSFWWNKLPFCEMPCGKRLRGYISSYGCCNRWAQTWWLKTTEMYSLHSGDWKTETSFTDCNQGVSKAVASSGGSRGESFPWHFQPWWLPASLTCGCITPINSSMVTLPPPFLCRVTLCLSFVRILLMALRDHLESPGKSPHLKNLNLGFLWWYRGKESTCQCKGRGFGPWAEKIPHATGQISPCATTTEPLHLEPELCNNDRPTHRNRE